MAEYGVDVLDLWRGGLSLRRLAVLVSQLPSGSRVWAIEQGVPHGWTLTDFLLTDIWSAFTGEPHPLRPTDDSAKKSKVEEQAAKLLAQRERIAKARAAKG